MASTAPALPLSKIASPSSTSSPPLGLESFRMDLVCCIRPQPGSIPHFEATRGCVGGPGKAGAVRRGSGRRAGAKPRRGPNAPLTRAAFAPLTLKRGLDGKGGYRSGKERCWIAGLLTTAPSLARAFAFRPIVCSCLAPSRPTQNADHAIRGRPFLDRGYCDPLWLRYSARLASARFRRKMDFCCWATWMASPKAASI